MEDTKSTQDMPQETDLAANRPLSLDQENFAASLEWFDQEKLHYMFAELGRIKSLLQQETSARQRVESELRKAKDIADATIQAREEFLATMSHELRTPLSVVLGYTDLLEEGEFGQLTESQFAILKRVRKNASDLLSLINALLDASYLQVGRSVVSLSQVRLGTALERVWRETQDLREASSLSFIYDVQSADTAFQTDCDKFTVILRNLLSNAAKFTDQGHVMLRGQSSEGGIEICVIDTGIGIKREEIPFMFKPFYKVGDAAARSRGGAGLGLYVVGKFVDLLGGKLVVESTIGSGSTFRLWLPTFVGQEVMTDITE